MKAVVVDAVGGPEQLRLADVPEPTAGHDDLLVQVAAAGVNRADVLQRKGFYPPPKGESELLGLEVAGVVRAMGPGVTGWAEGDRVFGLVAGGGYAEYCCLDSRLAMAMPEHWSFEVAAAIPEVFMTAHEVLFVRGELSCGEWVLIHGGGSGVGSTAIQMAAACGARIATTAGHGSKLERCAELGAETLVHYREQDFVREIERVTAGRGVDLILDVVGAAYLQRNLAALAHAGRLVLVGLLGGRRAELDMGIVLSKRLKIVGSIMRSLPIEEKVGMRDRMMQRWWQALLEGEVRPLIDCVISLDQVAQAHRRMEESAHCGKIVLRVGG